MSRQTPDAFEAILVGNQRDALSAISDAELAAAVTDVFERVRARVQTGQVDLVVLAARRLSCVYQALIRAGMEPLGCEVVSDRVSELSESIPSSRLGDSEEAAGNRNIALIDDCVVRGRTLARLVAKLSSSPLHNVVSVDVVCVDADQADTSILEAIPNLNVVARRSTPDARQFSLDLTRVLFQNLTPYFADFPVLGPHPLRSDQYLPLLGSDNWAAIETTPHLLKEPGLSVYTLVPSDETVERVRRRLGPSLAGAVSVLKVRVFVAFGSERPDEFIAVPLGLLKPLSSADVSKLLSAVGDELHTRSLTGTDWAEWGSEAQQRLLQMFVSLVLAQEWWSDLGPSDLFDEFDESLIDHLGVTLHFGEVRSQAVWRAIRESLRFSAPIDIDGWIPAEAMTPISPLEDHAGVQRCLTAAYDYYHSRPEPGTLMPNSIFRLGEADVRPIAGVFGYVGRLEQSQFHDRKDLRWLDEGLPLARLGRAIPGDNALLWTSFAIDVLNDLGVAVPTTHVESVSGCVYRRYRIGENVFLADALQGERITTRVGENVARRVRSKRHWLVSYFFSELRRIGRISPPVALSDRQADVQRLVETLVIQVSTPTR